MRKVSHIVPEEMMSEAGAQRVDMAALAKEFAGFKWDDMLTTIDSLRARLRAQRDDSERWARDRAAVAIQMADERDAARADAQRLTAELKRVGGLYADEAAKALKAETRERALVGALEGIATRGEGPWEVSSSELARRALMLESSKGAPSCESCS